MAELGLVEAGAAFAKTVEQKAPPKRKRPAKRPPKEPREPLRKSSRLRKVAEGRDGDEEVSELGWMLINDECPRCHKPLSHGHKRHLEACTAKPVVARQKRRREPRVLPGDRWVWEPVASDDEGGEEEGAEEGVEQEDEEGLQRIAASKEAERVKAMDAKLAQLDIGGLVELTDDHAKFVVKGSTGRPYNVMLSKEQFTCQCPDHRTRRHDCKHIRLVLVQLEIADSPDEWHEAVTSKLDGLVSS